MVKYFLIILILVPSFLFAKAEKPTLMLQLTGKNIKVSEDVKLVIRMGVEEVLTEKGYMLVSESNQKMALEEMSKQSKSECLDDSCLVDTGGMLAAKGIFIVEIVKLGQKFVFKVKNIDIETAAVLKTKSMVYKGKLDDADKLLPFSKELTNKIFKKHEATSIIAIPSSNKVEKDDGCNQDTPEVCLELANKYKDGDGIPVSIQKANEYYKKSCNFKSKNAAKICFELANKYKSGDGIPASIYNANEYYAKSCDLNNSDACLSLGDSYHEGNGFKVNIQKAANLYDKSCKLNNGMGCGKFGKIYFKGTKGTPKDLVKAHKYYEKSCDLKIAKACLYLAINYHKGIGLKKDLDKAFNLYKKTCSLDEEFCATLKPILKKINKKKFIDDICTVKSPEKCYELAKNHELGKGIKKDLALANKLYSKLCDLKYGKACNSLGYNYKYGIGYSKDLEKAISFYEKACEGNSKAGCLNAGKSYLSGVGVKRDKKKVYNYYKKACSLGFKDDICKNFKN